MTGLKTLTMIIACALPLAAHAQDRPTSREFADMPRENRDSLVRKDLLSRLLPGSRVLDRGIHGADAIVDGRGYATEFPGLCQRDQLTVHYTPVPIGSPAASRASRVESLLHPRLEPYGFSVGKQYRVISAKVAIPDPNLGLQEPLAGPCNAHTDSYEYGWFIAPDAETAAWAFNALAAAAEAIRAGPSATLACDEACRKLVLAGADAEKLIFVTKCGAEGGNHCFEITTNCSGECTVVTIRATQGGARVSMTVTRVSADIESDPAEIM